MLPHEIKQRLESAFSVTECSVNEFSGGNDHYSVVVVSPVFEGKSLLARHRLVMDLFQKEIESGEVHALSLQTFTPSQWAEK